MIDSKKSLDARRELRDAPIMNKSTYHLHVQRLDAAKNMARYYRLAIEPTLFGSICLVRNWGRVGTRGKQRIEFFDDENQALRLFLKILKRKRRRGYRPVPSTADFTSRFGMSRTTPATRIPGAEVVSRGNRWNGNDSHR